MRAPFVHDYSRYFNNFTNGSMRSFGYNNNEFYYCCLQDRSVGTLLKRLHVFVTLSPYIKLNSHEIKTKLSFPLLHFVSYTFVIEQIVLNVNEHLFSNAVRKRIVYLNPDEDTMIEYTATHRPEEIFSLDLDYLERVSEDWDFDYIVNSLKMVNFADGDYMRLSQK